MSTAEMTAHRIYDSYKFSTLPNEVKRQLAILFTISSEQDSQNEDYSTSPLAMSVEEKRARARRGYEDIINGDTCSTEELLDSIEKKHPWLCK